jgi:hypothetical protein
MAHLVLPAWLKKLDYGTRCPNIDLELITPVTAYTDIPILKQWIKLWNTTLESSYSHKTPVNPAISFLEQSGDDFYLTVYQASIAERGDPIMQVDLTLEEGAECARLFLLSIKRDHG